MAPAPALDLTTLFEVVFWRQMWSGPSKHFGHFKGGRGLVKGCSWAPAVRTPHTWIVEVVAANAVHAGWDARDDRHIVGVGEGRYHAPHCCVGASLMVGGWALQGQGGRRRNREGAAGPTRHRRVIANLKEIRFQERNGAASG